jgi:Sulfotransferase family
MTPSSEPGGADGAEPTAGRVPDFFVAGHHKSGTTAMYEMLRRHPQIFMPTMKEPEFFGRDLTRRRHAQPKPGSRQTYAQSRPHTYAEYLALFDAARPEQRAGEASPSYLGSLTAAEQIARVQPDARIVAILREPASFLRSLHLQMVRNHVQREPDLRKAIAGEGVAGEGQRAVDYTDRVRYVEQLRRYHEAFSREQVLVLIYEDFRRDNEAAVRSVLAFLEVDAGVPIETVNANPTVAARSHALDHWTVGLRAGRGPISRGAKSAVKAITPRRVRRDAVRAFERNVVYASAPPEDESLTIELRRRFKGEVVALSEYLGRDLVALWGYDGID